MFEGHSANIRRYGALINALDEVIEAISQGIEDARA